MECFIDKQREIDGKATDSNLSIETPFVSNRRYAGLINAVKYFLFMVLDFVLLFFISCFSYLDDGSQQVQKKGTMQYTAINPTSTKYSTSGGGAMMSSTQNSTAGGSTIQ